MNEAFPSQPSQDPIAPAPTSAAPKRAKKVRSACERCRYRRIKCDGHVPACGNCSKAKVACIDVDGHHTERRVARGLTAASASARIAWLENIIRTELPHIRLDGGPPFPSNHANSTALGETGRASSSSSPAASAWMNTSGIDLDGAALEELQEPNSGADVSRGQKRPVEVLNEPHSWTTSLEQDTRSVALDLGLLSLHSESPQVHYLGSSSGSLFPSLFQPRKRDERDEPNSPGLSGIARELDARTRSRIPQRRNSEALSVDMVKTVHELYGKLRTDLPPREECDMLIRRFFQHMHPNHPFLHQPSFKDIVDALYECKDAPPDCSIQHNGWPATMKMFCVNGEEYISRGQHKISITSHAAAFQLFVTLSIGATLQIRQRIYGYNPGALFKSATSLSNHVFSSVSLPIVQCVLLLAVHCLIDPEGYNIWTLIHIAIAHCVDLGLHREVGNSGKFSALTTEMRRRVFFCVYSLDSTIQGRPLGIADGTFDVQLPSLEITRSIESVEATEDLATMAYSVQVFKMARIISKIKTSFYKFPSQSDNPFGILSPADFQKQFQEELDSWLSESLRAAMDTVPIDQRERLQTKLEIHYHSAICLLYQPSQIIIRPSESALQNCFRSAATRLRLYEALYEAGALFHSWRTVQDLFLAGATVMYCVYISPSVRTSISLPTLARDLRSCSSSLSVGGEWWPIIKKAKASLERLSNHTLDMVAEKSQSEASNTHAVRHYQPENGYNFNTIDSQEIFQAANLDDPMASVLNFDNQLGDVFDPTPLSGIMDGILNYSQDPYDLNDGLWTGFGEAPLHTPTHHSENDDTTRL